MLGGRLIRNVHEKGCEIEEISESLPRGKQVGF